MRVVVPTAAVASHYCCLDFAAVQHLPPLVGCPNTPVLVSLCCFPYLSLLACLHACMLQDLQGRLKQHGIYVFSTSDGGAPPAEPDRTDPAALACGSSSVQQHTEQAKALQHAEGEVAELQSTVEQLQQQLQQYEEGQALARAALSAAEQKLQGAEDQVLQLKEELNQQAAQVKQAQAEVETLQQQLQLQRDEAAQQLAAVQQQDMATPQTSSPSADPAGAATATDQSLAQLEVLQLEVQQLQLQVQQLKQELADAKAAAASAASELTESKKKFVLVVSDKCSTGPQDRWFAADPLPGCQHCFVACLLPNLPPITAQMPMHHHFIDQGVNPDLDAQL